MRSIQLHPQTILRRRAEPVDKIDAGVVEIVADMIRIMRQEGGLGLAGPQVGESKRIFVTEASDEDKKAQPRVFINPRIVLVDGLLEGFEEGCLSLPEIRGTIRRQPHVIIEALDLQGNSFTLEASDIMARCWQHEMDHLDGVLIIDRMSMIDRMVNRKRLRALESAGEAD